MSKIDFPTLFLPSEPNEETNWCDWGIIIEEAIKAGFELTQIANLYSINRRPEYDRELRYFMSNNHPSCHGRYVNQETVELENLDPIEQYDHDVFEPIQQTAEEFFARCQKLGHSAVISLNHAAMERIGPLWGLDMTELEREKVYQNYRNKYVPGIVVATGGSVSYIRRSIRAVRSNDNEDIPF
ncbi:hypothetical protein FWC31_03525 [Candidatus Saccharibacteria bacterium]|nr:hypothetical protein [Candidatus Saccharibacteria bacterium]